MAREAHAKVAAQAFSAPKELKKRAPLAESVNTIVGLGDANASQENFTTRTCSQANCHLSSGDAPYSNTSGVGKKKRQVVPNRS